MLVAAFDRITNTIFSTPGVIVMAIAALVAVTLPARSGERVYVPLGGKDRILVVDAENDRVIAHIGDVSAVHGLAKTPDNRYLIAASFDERDPGAGVPARPKSVSAEDHAAHHGKSPDQSDGTEKAVSTVTIIRVADRSVTRRIDVPGGVHHVAASSDGRFAAFTHPNQDSTSIVDLRTFHIVATVLTGAVPNYAAFSPDGRRLFVSNAGERSISEIAVTDWSVRRKFAVGESPEHLVLSNDGGFLFVNNVSDGTVSVVDTDSGKAVETFTVGEEPHGIDLSDDNKTLFVAVKNDKKVVAVDLQTRAQKSLSLPPSPYHLRVVRGLGKIYVSNAEGGDLWIIDEKSFERSGAIPIAAKGHQMVQITTQ